MAKKRSGKKQVDAVDGSGGQERAAAGRANWTKPFLMPIEDIFSNSGPRHGGHGPYRAWQG